MWQFMVWMQGVKCGSLWCGCKGLNVAAYGVDAKG